MKCDLYEFKTTHNKTFTINSLLHLVILKKYDKPIHTQYLLIIFKGINKPLPGKLLLFLLTLKTKYIDLSISDVYNYLQVN